MENTEKLIKLTASDGTVVLIYTLSLPQELTPRAAAFYSDIAEAFERSVRERFHMSALRAYRECPDRRKRYRYSPWHALFRVEACDQGVVLNITANGESLRREKHLWRDDVLIKRVKLN